MTATSHSGENLREIQRLRRETEFNLTESQTLRNLVVEARRRGKEVRDYSRDLSNMAESISPMLVEQGLIQVVSVGCDNIDGTRLVGIDGSSYPVEGITGVLYVPMSAACVVFDNGFKTSPKVQVGASIAELHVSDVMSVGREVSMRMLTMETELLWDIAQDVDRRTVVFLDGPIVDPPMESNSDYVSRRCDAIRTIIGNGALVLGVVKSPRDRFLLNHIKSRIGDRHSAISSSFSSDLHFLAYAFTKTRKQYGYSEPLASLHVPITSETTASLAYGRAGVDIWSFYFQFSKGVRPVRIDWCREAGSSPEEATVLAERNRIARLASLTTYPGMGYPLPVHLAHQKCSIRQGCAEVLVDEIMTGGRAAPGDESVIVEILKGRE